MFIGIDLSLRSTGLVFTDGKNIVEYKLITSKLNDEQLLIYNTNEIIKFIKEYNPTHIAIEGLSFGSISGSKDILAGNFWYLRTIIALTFPDIKVDIIPVLTWRSKLFSKLERKDLKDNSTKLKVLKAEMKSLSLKERKEKALENEQLILNSDIKYLTWMKVPEPYKTKFESYGGNKGKFDITDAFWIADYIKNNHK